MSTRSAGLGVVALGLSFGWGLIAWAGTVQVNGFSSDGTLAWSGITNETGEFAVEANSNLVSGHWIALYEGLLPTGVTMTAQVPVGETSRFFRVRQSSWAVPTNAPPAGMAVVPGGGYDMGNAIPGEGNDNELPVHRVGIAPFFMDRHEVSLAQWESVASWATNGGRGYQFSGNASGKATNHPVESVTWFDCVKWCNARSEMDGLMPVYYTDSALTNVYRTGDVNLQVAFVNWGASGYRLPTEAEWERAARAGTSGTRFPWGATITNTQANYSGFWQGGHPYYAYDTSPDGFNPGAFWGDEPYTSPVGSFPTNSYGLSEMIGNVWEWCWDWQDDNYYAECAGGIANPRGPASGSGRVYRGGNWLDQAYYCRVSVRGSGDPSAPSYNIGFRTVAVPP